MSTDENELRYDRHKRKSKRRRKSKKNKTGKKRARIQVGGSTSDCPFCAVFWNAKQFQLLQAECSKRPGSKEPTCNENINKIKIKYANIKERKSLKANICDICGLDNNKITGKFGTVGNKYTIISRTLTNETADRGILSFEELTKKLDTVVRVEKDKSKGGLFSNFLGKKKASSVDADGGGGAASPKPAATPSQQPPPTPSAVSAAGVAGTASAVGPSLDQKDAKIQEHEATIATQKALIQEKAAIIDKQTSQLTEKDTIISTHKSTIDDRDEVVSRSTADKKREIEELTKQHSAELRQKDVQLDAMVEEKTTAKISDMFKPIGASSVFYVKISEDNAVDKLETIIEKLQKLKDQWEGEQRVGERRSSRRIFGKGKGKGKRGAGGGSVEVLSDVEDDDIFDAVAIKQEELKQKVKQNVLEPIRSDSDGADQAYPTPPPSPQEQPPTKGEITTTV